MKNPLEYMDGYFRFYKTQVDNTNDFPEICLVDTKMDIWYRELSVFDRTRHEFNQNGKEVTMKIRIPRYKGIDSSCVCAIGGVQHQVYNVAHVIDKSGFPETEITLIKPERQLSVV